MRNQQAFLTQILVNLDTDETLTSNLVGSNTSGPAFNAIKMYEYHTSIKNFLNFIGGENIKFSFIFETKNKLLADIHNLNIKKVCQESKNIGENN